MSKSTKSTSATPTLAELKLAVINFHKGNDMEYLRQQLARDACYTSANGLKWKTEQMSKLKMQIAELVPEQGTEVSDIKLARLVDIYHGMEVELEELQQRHDADLEVYTIVTEGEVWYAKPKKKADTNALVDAARAILA